MWKDVVIETYAESLVAGDVDGICWALNEFHQLGMEPTTYIGTKDMQLTYRK